MYGRGGKLLAKKWGTDVMDNPENDLTAGMVRLPLRFREMGMSGHLMAIIGECSAT